MVGRGADGRDRGHDGGGDDGRELRAIGVGPAGGGLGRTGGERREVGMLTRMCLSLCWWMCWLWRGSLR